MATTQTPLCLMCLENPLVVEGGPYQHSYCGLGLDKHRKTQQHGVVLPCPGCPIADGSSINADGSNEGIIGPTTPAAADDKQNITGPIKIKCKICHLKGKVEEATNVCEECSDLQICEVCTMIHGKHKLTQYHLVKPIAPTKIQKASTSCVSHGEPVRGYCCSCSKFVCHVCILVEHDDHDIKSLAEVFREKTDKANLELANQEKRLEELLSDERKLTTSKDTVDEMEAAVIKEIEDYADVCIEQILKSKEQLKTQVKSEFRVKELLEKLLDMAARLVKKSEDAIAMAKSALSEADICQEYLEKIDLVNIEEEIKKLKIEDPEYTKNMETYRNTYSELLEKKATFYRNTFVSEIGRLENHDPDKLWQKCERTRSDVSPEVCEPSPKPDPNAAGVAVWGQMKGSIIGKTVCDERGGCKCDSCGRSIRTPDFHRSGECVQKGFCACLRCGQIFREPRRDRRWEYGNPYMCLEPVIEPDIPAHPRRKKECYEEGLCVCKRCDRQFDIDMLTKRKGKCKNCELLIGYLW